MSVDTNILPSDSQMADSYRYVDGDTPTRTKQFIQALTEANNRRSFSAILLLVVVALGTPAQSAEFVISIIAAATGQPSQGNKNKDGEIPDRLIMVNAITPEFNSLVATDAGLWPQIQINNDGTLLAFGYNSP